ncbi:Hypothetical protein, predicted lipoprotein [Mycoplasmopsis agalactiae 14628]|uniref:Transglutaminase-like domain-containing protein n=1 Tax=Mycoplasmopsis agalactiae 14628 TaxID=1110504 RepID=I5D669_MYCAA|nr:transglutaminase domain-containing protein [Mycoplasmopsis agalactiae]EIN15178.1 Hypothetical protein, predicted lipoprotein [Mycoplasmopsis agalactiae 14628]
MKRIKKRYVNLALACSFSSVFASASCIAKGTGNSSNVINNPVNIVNNFTSSSTEFNNENSTENIAVNKNKNEVPSNNQIAYETAIPVSPQNIYSSTNRSILAPEVIDISNLQSISSAESKVPELDSFYIEHTKKDFVENKLNESQIESMILNYGVSPNFYSHPKYTIDAQNIRLDSNGAQTVKLNLIDSKTKEKVTDDVQWYQRNWYTTKEVAKAGEEVSDGKLILTSDGNIKGKSHTKNDFGKVQVWAHYKGYLYSTMVDVDSVDLTKSNNENAQARAKAKEIAKQWEGLPTLEKITEAYKWMTKNVKYDYSQTNLVDDQSAYSALVKLSTVCTGYAKGFKMIMEELGVPCIFMSGTADYGTLTGHITNHAWNLVEVDGVWYHVDTTSDRAENASEGKFNFFMMNDDDFIKASIFNRGFVKTGERFRNLKISNYVNSKDDVLVSIDRQLGGLDKLPKSVKFNVAKSSYQNVLDAFETAKLELNETKSASVHRHPYVTYDEVTYYFKEPQKTIDLKQVSASVEKRTLSNKELGQYALKVKINHSENNIDLKAGNFIVKNAYVKEAIKDNDGYTLILDHFSKYGSMDVELENIKKLGFKFDISNKKVNFNVTKNQKPNVSISAVGENRIKVSGVNSNMEYRNNSNEWKSFEHDNQVIDKVVLGSFSIRVKNTKDSLKSDIQEFKITKGKDLDKIVKKYGSNMLIGVDSTMEYRLKDATEWTSITATKLTLSPGEYLIRTSPKDNQLASESFKIAIS